MPSTVTKRLPELMETQSSPVPMVELVICTPWLRSTWTPSVLGLFPGAVEWLAVQIGFMSTANMVYLIVIFLLIIKLFLMDQRISHLQRQTVDMAQVFSIRQLQQEKEEAGRNSGKEAAE